MEIKRQYKSVDDIPFRNGLYWISLKPSLSTTGKPQNKPFKTPTAALKWYREQIRIAIGLEEENFEALKKKLKKSGITFKELLDTAVKNRENSLTLGEYRIPNEKNIRHRSRSRHSDAVIKVGEDIIKLLGEDKLIANVTEQDIQEFLDNPNWNKVSKNTKLRQLKSFFKFAVKKKYFGKNGLPWKDLEWEDEDKDIEFVSLECAENLFFYLLTEIDIKDPMRVCLTLNFFCGLGEDEVRRGKFKDIYIPEVGSPTLTVNGQKTDHRKRKIVLPQNVFEMLEPYRDKFSDINGEGSDEWFFPPAPLAEEQEDNPTLRSRWNKARRKISKNPDLIIATEWPRWPNSLARHSTGTYYYNLDGYSLADTKEFMGHEEDSKVTKKRYASLRVNSDQAKAYYEIGKHAWLRNKLQGVTSERNETRMA